MIEFPITLTSGGSVCLPGHAFALALGYTKNQGVYRLHIDATGEWEGLTIRAFWHVPDGKDPVSSLVADGYVAVPASVTAQPGNGCITFEGSDGTRTVTSADLRYRVSANSGTEDGTEPEPGTPAWQELVGAVHTDATAAEQAKTDAQTAATESAASAEKAAASKKAAGDAQAKATESLQELKNGIASGNFKGEPGTSPTVTVQDITGGHRIVITDATGTSSVDVLNGKQGDPGRPGDTGDALATKAVIDDTAVGLDAWSAKHIIDTLCPPLDETGNPVQCYPVEGYPLGVTASWEPVQAGSGEPSPDNIRPISGRETVSVERCGGNVIEFLSTYDSSSDIKIAVDAEKNITLNGTVVGKGNITIGMCRLHWVAGKNYTMYVKKVGGSASIGSGDGITFAYSLFTTDYNHYFRGGTNSTNLDAYIARDVALVETELIFMLQCWRDGTVFNNFKFQIEIVPGTTPPTEYTPYTGQTTTLTLPSTIYGGTVDAVTGDGQETWKLVTLDGTENWETWGVNENNAAVTGFYNYSINDYDPNGNKLLCSTMPYKNVDVWGGRNEGIGYANALNQSSRYMIYSVKTDTLSDASDNASAVASFKSYLATQYAAGTPVQIAYRLAEPVPFTVTGAQPISALPGVNTLMTDADTLTVTGRADPIKRITDLEDAVASMTNT